MEGSDPRTWPWTTSGRSSPRPEGDPARTCPETAAPSTPPSAFCPSCGKRYDRRFARVSDTQRWILAGLALAGVIVATILILPGVFDAKKDNHARLAREHAARVAAEKKRLIREQRPMRGKPANLKPPAPTASALRDPRRPQEADHRARGRDSRRRPAAREVRRARRPGEARELRPADPQPQQHRRGGEPQEPRGPPRLRRGQARGHQGRQGRRPVRPPVRRHRRLQALHLRRCKDNKVPGERGNRSPRCPSRQVCIGAEGRPRVADG